MRQIKLINIIKKRYRRIIRNIEAARLKRIRRHTKPGYKCCMNCGTPLKGMYCHQCGQYALDIYQPIWKYIRQYFENMYQFDGKVWMTLRLLFIRPGFLTNEFNSGKINSYVHPFRLYMFISVLFFTFFFMAAEQQTDRALLVFNSQQIPDSVVKFLLKSDASSLPDTTVYAYNTKTLCETLRARGIEQADSMIRQEHPNIETTNELSLVSMPKILFDSCMAVTPIHQEDLNIIASLKINPKSQMNNKGQNIGQNKGHKSGNEDTIEDDIYIGLEEKDLLDYTHLADIPVDSVTGMVSVDAHDWMIKNKQTDILHQQATASFVLGQLSKWTPFYLMFLLPLQALIFKIFYRRKRYMEHFAHSTHLSSMLLILLSIPATIFLSNLNMWNSNLEDTNKIEDTIYSLFPLVLFIYQLFSMHIVYKESWAKSTIKCIITYGIFYILALLIAAGLIVWLVAKVSGRV